MRKVVILLFIISLSYNILNANLFLEKKRVGKLNNIKYFDVGVVKSNIAYVLLDQNNNIYYTASTNAGKSFTKLRKIKKYKAIQAGIALGKNIIVILWTNPKIEKAGIILIKNFTDYRPILEFNQNYILNPMLKIDSDNNILLVYQEIIKDNSIIKFKKIDRKGNIIIEKRISIQGNGHLPKIEFSNNKYLIVWNNIYGDKNEILSIYSRDKGKKWSKIKNITSNDIPDTGPDIRFYQNKFYCIWQDKRLGVWNISYAEFTGKEWINYNRVTSGLINCWLPQISFYKNNAYIMWIDNSENNSVICYKKKNLTTKLFGKGLSLENIKKVDSYKLKFTKHFILLSFLKRGILYFSKLYSKTEPLKLNVQNITTKNCFKISWASTKKDIASFCINFSFNKPSKRFFVPVVDNSTRHFFLYYNNLSLINKLYFEIKYYDDIGMESPVTSTILIKSKKNAKKTSKKLIDWNQLDADKIFYNILNNKFYITIKYNETFKIDDILNKLYFFLINKFKKEKNKFIRVFNLLNGNIDFTRLIKDDKIFLPNVWGEIFYLTVITDRINNMLLKYEEEFNLKNDGYLFYIVSKDFKKFLPVEKSKKGDYLIILRGK